MRTNKTVKVIKVTRTSDGMGGHDEIPVEVSNFKVYSTPLTAELAMKDYGLVTTSGMRFITKDRNPLPEDYSYLLFEDKHYTVLQYLDLKPNLKVLLVEVE